MKEKNAFIFFNCDEEKSQKSMNVFYNKEIFRDLKVSRKALFAKIEEELASGRIHAKEEDIPAIRDAILNGNPTDASSYIQYGTILSDCLSTSSHQDRSVRNAKSVTPTWK